MKVISQHIDTALTHISAICKVTHISAISKLTMQTTHENCCLPSKVAPVVLKLLSSQIQLKQYKLLCRQTVFRSTAVLACLLAVFPGTLLCLSA